MVHLRCALVWAAILGVALCALGCTPDAELEVHINAGTDVPPGTTVSYAELQVWFQLCEGGIDAECKNALVTQKDVSLDLQNIVMDEVSPGPAPVDEIGGLWSYVDLANGCRLSPAETAARPAVEKGDDRIVYSFEGTYEMGVHCSFP